ncbi:hypothetical protein PG996_000224 [Apiospora saccharicola]|uniref:Uncharacterized protein n=1 Tax=Apiospora saccharicola TaxID=335842 RepID=A0ABR1WDE2_9PEZI
MRYLLNCLIAACLAVSVSAIPSPVTITTNNHPIPSDAPAPEKNTNNATVPYDPFRFPDPRGPFCDIPGRYQSTQVNHVDADIAKLHRHTDDCAAPAHGCARVSCTDGGAVWMCNDNDEESRAPCSVLGDYAQMILDKCPRKHGKNTEVQGQMFDAGSGPGGSGGWGNVIVGLEGWAC